MKKYKIFTALVLAAASVLAGSAKSDKENKYGNISNDLDLFNTIVKELNMYYVDTINTTKATETAINAMLYDVDPYTEYIPERDQEDFFTISTGEYGGIGSYIMKDKNGGVLVSQPFENSPAYRAGLRAGDKFMYIDGDTVSNWTSDKVSSRLKGLVNTDFTVTVKRPYCTDSMKTFKITREKINVNTVPYYGIVRGKVGYIQLTTFNEKSPELVENALRELKKNPAIEGIVLDLRNNGGGLLESAVKIVGLFVPKGTEVVRTRGRLKQSEKVYKTPSDPVDTKIKLAVLINESSASASEITAGALQDLDRAVIIGNRSFGKGLVQSTRPLGSNGLLKITISKYYIPSGRLIQAIDYSHRNPDGSVSRTPDSLTTVFKTRNGREVRDGGGITPDVNVEYPELNRLVFNIVRDQWAFNFGTKFAATHKSIAPIEDFEITDEIFNDFKAFIDPEKFEYDKVCETRLADLKKAAKMEGYLNDSTEAVFNQLEKLLKHNLDQDLKTNKEAICKILASEIVMRYYFERGHSIQYLKHDLVTDEFVKVLTTPGRYEELLKLKAEKASAKKNGKKAAKKSKK